MEEIPRVDVFVDICGGPTLQILDASCAPSLTPPPGITQVYRFVNDEGFVTLRIVRK